MRACQTYYPNLNIQNKRIPPIPPPKTPPLLITTRKKEYIQSRYEDSSPFHLLSYSLSTIAARRVLRKMPSNRGMGAKNLKHMSPISRFLGYLESVLSNGSTQLLMCSAEKERELWERLLPSAEKKHIGRFQTVRERTGVGFIRNLCGNSVWFWVLKTDAVWFFVSFFFPP